MMVVVFPLSANDDDDDDFDDDDDDDFDDDDLKPEKVRTSRRFSLSQAIIPSRLISGRLCFILIRVDDYHFISLY